MSFAAPPTNPDVVIVGAGPVGLAAGCSLRSKGVDAVIVDAAAEAATTSRATVIHSHTLEVLAPLGVTEKILQKGRKISSFSLRNKKTELTRLSFAELDAEYPMVITLKQSDTEALLTAKYNELGGTIFHNARASSIEDVGDEVTIGLTNAENAYYSMTTKYVVGADGLHSFVRSAAGIDFEGDEYAASFIVADCVMSSWPLPTDHVNLLLADGGFLLYVPLPEEGLFRLAASVPVAPPHPDIDFMRDLIEHRGPERAILDEVRWSGRFHIHHRVAASYRSGRILLAGDAAHVHSPAGAQGMNIGIQDGLEAGNVLAEALLSGKDKSQDLDRYEERRRHIAQGVVGMTHRMTLATSVENPILRSVRDWAIWGVAKLPGLKQSITRTLAELE